MAHTLLLADDSVTIQRVIELTFADEDVNVVAVSNGDQAIAALDQAQPDIVLADVEMPGRNGYEVAEHIKRNPNLAHIPVVLLTGAFEPIDQARATAAGCEGVLSKPFEPQLVVGRVRELLGRDRPKPAAESRPPSPATVPTWTPRFAEPRVPPSKTSTAEVDSYFDRLDAAFASLSAQEDESETAPAEDIAPVPATMTATQPEGWGRPAARQEMPVNPVREPEAHTPSSEAAPLADAFTAFLAEEQHQPLAESAPSWLSNRSAPVREELVDEVTRRVVEHVSTVRLREMVAEIVTTVAERLVREEIERIKSSIK